MNIQIDESKSTNYFKSLKYDDLASKIILQFSGYSHFGVQYSVKFNASYIFINISDQLYKNVKHIETIALKLMAAELQEPPIDKNLLRSVHVSTAKNGFQKRMYLKLSPDQFNPELEGKSVRVSGTLIIDGIYLHDDKPSLAIRVFKIFFAPIGRKKLSPIAEE